MLAVLRSLLYVPGNNARLVLKARGFAADVIVLDMEDSVPFTEKEAARALVRDSIATVRESGADVYVRVNSWETGLTDADLEAIVRPGLDGVVLPKTETADDVRRLDRKLEELERRVGLAFGAVAAQLIVETAKGVLNAYQCAVASRRVNALCFGAVDYSRDMRVQLTRDGWEVFHARSQVGMVARAAGLVAIDSAWPAYADAEGFVKDTKAGAQLGYEGRVLIHPNQIEPAHAIYSPSNADVEQAREVVAAFESGLERGAASVPLRGSMVDWPVYRSAKEVLAKADLTVQKERTKQERRGATAQP
ncbi:MAG: CoA ester lyase [Chloroflexota bacterium]|nr:CoA ester lyase [Chloroflexota bacterium]